MNTNCTLPKIKIWCGPQNCLIHPNMTEPTVICAADESCVLQTDQVCFTPPCLPWGVCRPLDAVLEPHPPAVQPHCLPNQPELSDSRCARITLLFEKHTMPVVSTQPVISPVTKQWWIQNFPEGVDNLLFRKIIAKTA